MSNKGIVSTTEPLCINTILSDNLSKNINHLSHVGINDKFYNPTIVIINILKETNSVKSRF